VVVVLDADVIESARQNASIELTPCRPTHRPPQTN